MIRSRRSLSFLVIACALVAMANSCDGSNNITGPSLLPFLFDITNIWIEEGNPDHEFNMTPTSAPSSASGTFEGEETRELADGSQENSDLSGSFQVDDISFSIQRSDGDVTFSGKIINENRMEVSSSTESLVIIR